MRVTAKGEYATQAVLHLSLQYPGVVAIHDIAQRHHIPLKYLEQILLELKRGAILESRRGVNGGYTLARAPEGRGFASSSKKWIRTWKTSAVLASSSAPDLSRRIYGKNPPIA